VRRPGGFLARTRAAPRGVGEPTFELGIGPREELRDVREPPLGALAQLLFQPPTLGVSGLDDTSARRLEVGCA
jgi:hypothetical protein